MLSPLCGARESCAATEKVGRSSGVCGLGFVFRTMTFFTISTLPRSACPRRAVASRRPLNSFILIEREFSAETLACARGGSMPCGYHESTCFGARRNDLLTERPDARARRLRPSAGPERLTRAAPSFAPQELQFNRLKGAKVDSGVGFLGRVADSFCLSGPT